MKMNKNEKGFLLIEVIMGLFLLGIIVVNCFPLLNIAIDNINIVKRKVNIVFVAESIMEKIKFYDYDLLDGESIFDMELKELVDIFNNSDSVIVKLPIDEENRAYEYFCTIYKNDINDKLWKISIHISPKVEKKNVKDVILQSIIPKP